MGKYVKKAQRLNREKNLKAKLARERAKQRFRRKHRGRDPIHEKGSDRLRMHQGLSQTDDDDSDS